MEQVVRAVFEGRDEAELRFEVVAGEIQNPKLMVIGCPEMLTRAQEFRKNFKGQLAQIPLPQGEDHAAILFRELLTKAQGTFKLPYQDPELCHCRSIETARVDQAIMAGAKSVLQINELTSAGTACGTCRPDIQNMIDYRLGKI